MLRKLEKLKLERIERNLKNKKHSDEIYGEIDGQAPGSNNNRDL